MAAPKDPLSVRITMLGHFTITVDGDTLTDDINRSQKLWNVLAYLIVHRDRAAPQSEFVEQFWPDDHSANPISALKTLLYRVRAMLLPCFGGKADPILSQRGSYSWNKDIVCHLDTDEFAALCQEAAAPALSDVKRLELRRKADRLYHGDFLPKLCDEMWVVPLSTRLHNLYLENTKALCHLLDTAEQYEEMNLVSSRAAELAPLDEEIHVLVIRSLLRQGKDTAALTHYENTTDLLYRQLGVHPSDELRALYTEIMAVEQGLETDLGVIQSDLREAAARPGAFVCEYGFFKEAYRLEARRAGRNGVSVHVALITVAQPNGATPELKVLSSTMDQLLQVLTSSLRRGDVVAKYSGAQYVIMLPSANFEDSTMVMDRVVSSFYRQHRRNFLKLSYKIRALD